MLDFDVGLQRAGGVALVTVTGELDIATAPQLAEVLGQVDGERIVVDMRATTFVDSTGLTTLARAHKQVGGAFAIVCTADNLEIRRVVDLMGFDQLFTIHETPGAAGWDGGEIS